MKKYSITTAAGWNDIIEAASIYLAVKRALIIIDSAHEEDRIVSIIELI